MKIPALGIGCAHLGGNSYNGLHAASPDETASIFYAAALQGVRYLDTAAAYLHSESRIGTWMRNNGTAFKVMTKFNHMVEVEESLERLGLDRVDTLFFHNGQAGFLKSHTFRCQLAYIKALKVADHIGVSLYTPEEARYALDAGVTCLEVPMSFANRSFLTEEFKGVRLVARSVLLKGRLPIDLALTFMRDISRVDVALVGVHSLAQLLDVFRIWNRTAPTFNQLIDTRLF